jgi:GNAT superfamily N-acetyltransferase
VSSTVVHVHHDSVQIHRATAQDSRAIADVLTLGFQRSGWIDSLLQPLWHFSLYDDLRHRLVPSPTPYACWLVTYDPDRLPSPDASPIPSSQQRLPIATVELSVRPSDTWSRDPWVWPTWPLGSIRSILSTGQRHRKQYPYIANLAVIASARRRGIARRLLERCERTALAWGYDRLYLHVLENNTPARSLYHQQGYRPQQIITTPSSFWLKQPRQILLCKILTPQDTPR